MCQSQAAGGKRCAAHTRPKFEAATPGTPEWEEAATEYARTKQGREVVTAAVLAAVGERDWERAAAHEHALSAADRANDAQAEYNRLAYQAESVALRCQDPDRLRRLADSGDPKVRLAVASNKHTPDDVLIDMATNGAVAERARVASRIDLPDDAYRVLLRDKNGSVQNSILAWTNRPDFVIRDWAADENYYKRRHAVRSARDPRFSDMLEPMAEDPNQLVRYDVASNTHTPVSALRRLAYDPDLRVASAAMANSSLPADDLEPALVAQSERFQANDLKSSLELVTPRQDVLHRLQRDGLGHLAAHVVKADA